MPCKGRKHQTNNCNGTTKQKCKQHKAKRIKHKTYIVKNTKQRPNNYCKLTNISYNKKKVWICFKRCSKLSWQLHRCLTKEQFHSKRWKLLACQLSTVLYKNVLKEAGGKRYLPLLFLPFIPRIKRVATAATSVGVVTPGVEIAGAPSVVSRVSPLLLLCSSAPTLLLLLGLWRSVRCSPQWWQHPVESGGTALRKVKIVFFTFSFLTLLIRENIPGSCRKTNVSQRCTKYFIFNIHNIKKKIKIAFERNETLVWL